MISIAAGIIAVSSFLPQATLVVNATPGIRVEVVEMKIDGSFVPAATFVTSYRATSRPRKLYIKLFSDTKALCAQSSPVASGPNTLSVLYRSCSLLPSTPTPLTVPSFAGLK